MLWFHMIMSYYRYCLMFILSDQITVTAKYNGYNGVKPGCLADRLLTGLGQPQINPQTQKEKERVYCSAEKGKHEQVGC